MSAVRDPALDHMNPANRSAVVLLGLAALVLAGFLLAAPPSMPVAAVVCLLVVFLCLCLVRIEAVLAAGVFAILFSPEVELFSVGSFVKPLYVRLEDMLIVTALVGLLGNRALRGKPVFRRTPLDVPILVFLCVYVLATARGILTGAVANVSSVFLVAKMAEYFMFFFLAAGFLEERKQAVALMCVFFAMAGAISLYYLPQIAHMTGERVTRITSPFEGTPEPTTAAGVLLMIMVFALSFALHLEDRRLKTAAGALFGVASVPFLYTLSRTGYAAGLVALVVFAIAARRAWVLLAVPVLAAMGPLVLPAPMLAKLAGTFGGSGGSLFDSSTMERLRIWRKVSWNLRRSPFLGYGAGYGDVIDSNYARMLMESGVLGLAAFAAILAVAWKMVEPLRRDGDPFERSCATGYVVLTAALLVHAFAAITFYIVRIVEFYWLLTGLMAFLAADAARRRPAPDARGLER